MNTPEKTSEKLKHFRRLCGLSQEALAEASGISIRTIQRIEKGLSSGNAYTISTLAKALNVNSIDLLVPELNMPAADLVTQTTTTVAVSEESRGCLKLLNLSSICVILVPLSNLVFPAIILWRNRENEVVNGDGRKILSFQILWVLFTLLLMITILPLMLFLFEPLRRGGLPLAVPLYFISVLLNVYCTIRFAFDLNRNSELVRSLPNIL
jgi:transcriptional regulator with XRE-family HTH domain